MSNLNPQQTSFLTYAAQAAVLAENATGCPAELSVGQAILESGWGKACPGNNCFGIKSTDSHCTYQVTKEYLNGHWQTLKLAFEAYDTLADCFTAHARLIQGGRYSTAWRQYEEDRDLDGLIRGIAGIYATDPNYATNVLSLAHSAAVTTAILQARG